LITIIEEHGHCKIEIECLRRHIETLNKEIEKRDQKIGSLISDFKKKMDEKIPQFEKGLLQVTMNVLLLIKV
jgi:hypothetical protein